MTSLEWLNSFPEFSTVTEAIKNAYISEASGIIDTSRFKASPEYVIALYAAHIMALNHSKVSSLGGGVVTAIREGDLSVSYAAGSGVSYNDYLYRTSYGAILAGMLKAGAISMNVVI